MNDWHTCKTELDESNVKDRSNGEGVRRIRKHKQLFVVLEKPPFNKVNKWIKGKKKKYIHSKSRENDTSIFNNYFSLNTCCNNVILSL